MTTKPRTRTKRMEPNNEIEVAMKKMLEDLCTTSQAAELLGVKRRQILFLIKDKKIAAVHLGHRYWVVFKPSLTTYLKSKSRRGRPPSGSVTSAAH